MSRHIQVTFDARDPQALSSFWRDVLGYVHPGPPGADLPEDADPLAAWDEFLARAGVPEEQRNTRSAIEDPDGYGPRLFFQQVPEDKDTCVKVGFKLIKGSLADAPTLARRATWSSRTHQMHQRNRAPRTHRRRIR